MRLHLRHKQQHFAVDAEPVGAGYRMVIDGVPYAVEAHHTDGGTLVLIVDGRQFQIGLARKGRERLVAIDGETYTFVSEAGAAPAHSMAIVAPPEIVAPMPGKVLNVLVHPGDHVAAGDGLVILEAMKMENRLIADSAATVVEARVTDGQMVEGGQVLVVLSYDKPEAS